MAAIPQRLKTKLFLVTAIEVVCLVQMVRAWGTGVSLSFYGPLVIAVAAAVVCWVMIGWRE